MLFPQVCNVEMTDMLMSGSWNSMMHIFSLRDRDRLTLVNPWIITIMKLREKRHSGTVPRGMTQLGVGLPA